MTEQNGSDFVKITTVFQWFSYSMSKDWLIKQTQTKGEDNCQAQGPLSTPE